MNLFHEVRAEERFPTTNNALIVSYLDLDYLLSCYKIFRPYSNEIDSLLEG